MDEEKAEEIVAKKPYKRIAEPIILFMSACWMAAVAIFHIEDPTIVSSVGAVIAASAYPISALVDRSRRS